MNEITSIPLGDAAYPPLLARLPQPPETLYVRGDVAALHMPLLVAIVGTRRMTRYGETVTKNISTATAKAGVGIVSGLALGIDAAAHVATLAAGGITIAVLASGVDAATIGPRSNARLGERIVASGGALVSEYPPGMPSQKFSFVARNRIVAGLCRAVAVVEAPENSGALITARFALDANRDVFAVPGPITSPMSAGTNDLLVRGAIPITDEASILRHYKLVEEKSAIKIILTEKEKSVIAAVNEGFSAVDALAEKTGMETAELLATLALLELTGVLVRDGASYLSTLTSQRRSG